MKANRDHDLRTRLNPYSHGARVVLAKTHRSPAARHWTAYSAAVGAALSITPAVEAAPIYSGVRNVEVNSGFFFYAIDVDADGQSDLLAYFEGFTPPPYVEIYLQGTGYFFYLNGFLTMNFREPQRLATGDDISSMAGPFSTAVIAKNGRPVGGWPSNGTGFAGFRFQRPDGEHFGWMRLQFRFEDNPDPYLALLTLTVRDWAYESVPGASIEAGDGLPSVAEPNGLALLATGAAGVLAWRRQRRTRDGSQPSRPGRRLRPEQPQ